jgi:hypothetical protein
MKATNKLEAIGRTLQHIGGVQEAWGNRSYSVVTVPAGKTAEDYKKELELATPYSYPTWWIVGAGVWNETAARTHCKQFNAPAGALVEEFYYSIGD